MAIAFVREGHNDTGSAASVVITVQIDAGNTVCVMIHTLETGGATPVTSVVDSSGVSVYLKKVSTQGSTVWSDAWCCLSASAATDVTVSFSPNATANVAVLVFSGVSSFGNTNVATNTSTTPAVSVTMQDANNWLAASASNYAGPGAISSPIGNIRISAYNNNQASSFATSGDNTQAGAGSITWGYTSANSTLWQAIGIELRSGGVINNNIISWPVYG